MPAGPNESRSSLDHCRITNSRRCRTRAVSLSSPVDPRKSVSESYDRVAADYAARMFQELDGKPIDRALLDDVAAHADGLICDLGCGPGHVARYLHKRGAVVCGIDISPAMIAEARRLTPGLRFEVGDLRALSFADETVSAVVAMYSLIHLDPVELGVAINEIARVLTRNGIFLAGFHSGNEVRHVDDLWGHRVELDFHFFEPGEITSALEAAGLKVTKVVEREPYAGVEVETRRFYTVAAKPGN